ncbi:hypothetical protein BDZ97DRAFT_266016 [Flammula alnicola]|nr:hypothetical protein BDZ97DRAFT_266016 [Flammula alnicola]
MKARVKDTIGRQQKGFFGRQRLDILSKGLAASKPSETSRVPTTISSRGLTLDIDLAHAKQKIPLDDMTYKKCFIPSPVHISPSTPRSHKRTRKSDEHTSSSSASRSEVLDALDISERQSSCRGTICARLVMLSSKALFLRRLMDQILAMPNLACLSDHSASKLSSATTSIRSSDRPESTRISPTKGSKRKVSILL